MSFLADLWLPIVLAAVVVFVVSALAWMVLPHHNDDIKVLPDEPGFVEFLGKTSLTPGLYMWPGCKDAKDQKTQEFQDRYKKGPWGTINIVPAQPNFARNLVVVFLTYLVISVMVGYLTSLARPLGVDYTFSAIFRVAGATAVLAYCAGSIPNAIFFSKSLRFCLTDFVDGLIYGLLTGAIFAFLWPGT